MSSNVGLTTPRGSGTSGYVQRNSAFLKPRNFGPGGTPYPPPSSTGNDGFGSGFGSEGGFQQRQPDKAILEHEKRREIEVKVFEEREKLEEENDEIEEGKGEEGAKVLSEEEIEERCDQLRERLVKDMEERARRGDRGVGGRDGRDGKGKRGFKAHQVHELAEAKIAESERLRKALGIREEGGLSGPDRRGGSGGRGDIERKDRERNYERGRESARSRSPE
ncbi:cwf21 domain-containing protein [Aspergillus californicus]